MSPTLNFNPLQLCIQQGGCLRNGIRTLHKQRAEHNSQLKAIRGTEIPDRKRQYPTENFLLGGPNGDCLL